MDRARIRCSLVRCWWPALALFLPASLVPAASYCQADETAPHEQRPAVTFGSETDIFTLPTPQGKRVLHGEGRSLLDCSSWLEMSGLRFTWHRSILGEPGDDDWQDSPVE